MCLCATVLMAVFVYRSALEVTASNIEVDDTDNSDESLEIEWKVTKEVDKSNLTTAIFSTLGGIILLSVLFVLFLRLLSKKWKEQRQQFSTRASARLQLSTVVQRQSAGNPLTEDVTVLTPSSSVAYSEKPPPSYEEAVYMTHGIGLNVLTSQWDTSIPPPPYERIGRGRL
ncbi:uncharacterized protein LOC143242064 isoform X2 [Tachypleus tridentatus]|uniref:uncharacterized protein LOC143242064 isoform X2 n=1 Tax=Tachypleus tridentatus TaxID=6853 RepID=UPI003FD3547A